LPNFFDPHSEYQSARRKLPHWNQEGVTYFVTFHLGDSLPVEKLAALKEEKKRWLDVNRPPLSATQSKEYHQRFSARIQRWLDSGYGSCVLARPEIRILLEKALRFFDGDRYVLDEHVVMPNHVHALVQPLSHYTLASILHSWKSFSANQINRINCSHGPVWHQESFDRIVRSPAHYKRIQEYIRANPKVLPPGRRSRTRG
jgi:REP element-mobilizing transposase RayT